jgi:hypothetical protein
MDSIKWSCGDVREDENAIEEPRRESIDPPITVI